MARKFYREYSRKLRGRNFAQGRILDVGCGFGETLIRLSKYFPQAECVGFDLSEPLLEIAESNAAKAVLASRVIFKKPDVQEIPYQDDCFDVVLNINVAHLVSDPVRMFN